MKLLIDYHHDCLYEAMALLCDRLGWELYRPIGMEWYEQGYWNHERHFWGDAIAKQYLERWGSDGPNTRLNTFHGRTHNLLSLDEARDLKPDIVMSSLAHNHEGFHRLAQETGARFGLQIGNVRFSPEHMQEDRWDLADFGLVSGRMPAPVPKPHVVYHQEFSGYWPMTPPRMPQQVLEGVEQRFTVASFVQCYPQDGPTYDYWLKTAPLLPDMAWKVYGAYGNAPSDQYEAGNLNRCAAVADAMRDTDVAWHAKRWSDGYGYVFHQWFAVGRPMLGFREYYANQLGGDLWLEGETAWDIATRSPGEVADLLRRFRDDEEFHLRACEASAKRFREVVNFDEEEQAIRALFAQVL